MAARKELRSVPRAAARLPVRIRTLSDKDKGRSAVTSQIGLCGCMIEGDSELGAGRVVRLSIRLDGHDINAIAKVLYEYPSDGHVFTGVQFEHIEEDQTEFLKTFVLRNALPPRR